MSEDRVPDKDHIARLCLPSKIENENIQASAFMLRKDEIFLSVNWLEILNCTDREDEISEIRNVYSAKFTVSKNAKLAVLNVGELCKKVVEKSPDHRMLEVFHTPIISSGSELGDPSHSEIYHLMPDHETIAELIVQTIQQTYPARA
ncbi:MAG: hypothetical protein IIB45_06205 [Candidatus Marinimicrobia bacterium]|nr:hypothetical protein [Candidatus Neomarinimicrobiota bacterium]